MPISFLRKAPGFPFFSNFRGTVGPKKLLSVNGEERIHAACRGSEAALVVDFPVYGTQLQAGFEPDGHLTGIWYRERTSGRVPLLAFDALPISEPNPRARFVEVSENRETDQPRADFAGIWRMEFDLYGLARGVFTQDAWGVVRGTAEIPSEYGDLRFLAGNVRGKHLEVSTFDGQHAVLMQAEIGADGRIKGHIEGHGGLKHSWDDFVAERAESVQMPSPLDRVVLLSGNQLDVDSLRGPKYAGKPVILEIFGTWCPGCNDHAKVVAELYRKHHGQGLEILGLALELSSSPELKERRVREFKKRHGVEWEVLIAETTLEELAREGFAGLSKIEGVPITIFVNRDGTVHEIYTGFSGPATGEAYLEARAQFHQLTAEILR